MSKSLRIELPTAGVVCLGLARPSKRNALSRELVQGLSRELSKLAATADLRAVILSGEGESFCSGADLSELVDLREGDLKARIAEFQAVILSIVELSVPVIAAIEGPAVGFGADLALCCDARVMGAGAYLEQGFVHMGLMPDGGGSYWAEKYFGPRALEALVLGRRWTAQECGQLGVACALAEQGGARAEGLVLAKKIAQQSLPATTQIKRVLRRRDRSELSATLDDERDGQARLLASAQFKSKLRNFLDRGNAAKKLDK